MTGRRSTGRSSTAVMANRAPRSVEDLDPQRALWRALDYFPTPPWAARAGAELIGELDPSEQAAGDAWEPACGEGHMAQALRDSGVFHIVAASDIHPFGFGMAHDFLAPDAPDFVLLEGGVDWVVTNPPFKLGAEFARRGLQVARRGVALLLRLSFLESADRFPLLFGDTPVSVVAPFCERVPMQLGSWNPQVASATAYAWFVWLKPHLDVAGLTDDGPRLRPIPPGTKARLSRREDARRWAPRAAAPLLEGGA